MRGPGIGLLLVLSLANFWQNSAMAVEISLRYICMQQRIVLVSHDALPHSKCRLHARLNAAIQGSFLPGIICSQHQTDLRSAGSRRQLTCSAGL